MQIKSLVWLILFGLFVCLFSCKKDEPIKPVPPPDPCKGLSEVKASFDIYEPIKDSLNKTDTVIAYGQVIFKTKEKYDSIWWRVGYDDRVFAGSVFGLWFNEPAPQQIPVTMIVYKKPNLACFPKDDGRDTLTKTLFIKAHAEANIIGKYKGYVVGREKDIFTVEIGAVIDKSTVARDQRRLYMKNINKGCYLEDDPNWLALVSNIWFGNNGVRMEASFRGTCQGTNAYAYLLDYDHLIIDYSIADTTKYTEPTGYARIKEKFVGIRIR